MDRAHESLDPEELLSHAGWVRALAVALVGESKADDLAQATLLRAIERPPRHKSNVRAWLGTIARNFAISWSRKDIRQRELLQKRVYENRRDRETAAESASVPETPDQLLGKSESATHVMQALQDLPDPGRHLLMLRYVEGLTPAEIAERYDMKAVTVRVQLSRALEELRRLMRHRFGGDGMEPCRALLAPLPAPWIVPVAPGGSWLGPSLTVGGIITATAVGVYLWDASGAPPTDPLTGVEVNQVQPDESERDSEFASLTSTEGDPGATRSAVETAAFRLSVVDESSRAIEGARLRLHREGASVGSGSTDSRGILANDQAFGPGVLQLSAIDHTPELQAGDWPLGDYRWVLPEREQITGMVGGELADAGRGLFLALVGDEPLYREGTPEFELLGEIDQRYASFQRFLVSVRAGGEFRYAGLPAGWSGYLTSGDPRFRVDDAGLDDLADGRLRVEAGASELRVRLVEVPRIRGQVLPSVGQSSESLRGAILALRLPEGVLRMELDETGCFELLRDPAQLEGLELRIHAPRGGEAAFSFASLPVSGDLGELQLQPLPATWVQVTDATGRGIEGASVSGMASDWFGEALGSGTTETDAAGLASLALSQSSEALLVRAPGFAPRRIERGELKRGSEPTEIPLTASNGLRLTIEGPDGPLPIGAAANLEIRIESEHGLLSGDPNLDRGFAPRRGSVLTAVVRSQGLVAARLLPNAAAQLELEGVQADRALRLQVLTRTGQLLLEQQLAPLAPAGREDLVLRLPRAPRDYEGVVTGPDGRSVSEAVVMLRAPTSAGDEAGWLRAVTDLQGRFRFPALWREEVALRVSAPGFALTLDSARALPAAGTPDQIQLEAGRRLSIEILDLDGSHRMPMQLMVRGEDGRTVHGAAAGEDGSLRVDGLSYTPLEVEIFVDGWLYRETVDSTATELRLQLPERFELPIPTDGWAGPTADAELMPHLKLHRDGDSTAQLVFLVPHPQLDNRWVLPARVLLPAGDWVVETPDGQRSNY
jgi:RNA polymerase sigma factor (sigma-70 family)